MGLMQMGRLAGPGPSASTALALVVLIAVAGGARPASSLERGQTAGASPSELAMELLVLRPIGVARILFGTAFFLVSVPFMATPRRIGESWEFFVDEPVSDTFKRDLGDF